MGSSLEGLNQSLRDLHGQILKALRETEMSLGHNKIRLKKISALASQNPALPSIVPFINSLIKTDQQTIQISKEVLVKIDAYRAHMGFDALGTKFSLNNNYNLTFDDDDEVIELRPFINPPPLTDMGLDEFNDRKEAAKTATPKLVLDQDDGELKLSDSTPKEPSPGKAFYVPDKQDEYCPPPRGAAGKATSGLPERPVFKDSAQPNQLKDFRPEPVSEAGGAVAPEETRPPIRATPVSNTSPRQDPQQDPSTTIGEKPRGDPNETKAPIRATPVRDHKAPRKKPNNDLFRTISDRLRTDPDNE